MKRAPTDIEDLAKWQPKNWPITLENIRRMRMHADAPVDTMGCHRLADENEDPKTYRLQLLISLMLSAQTKDEVTAAAVERLIVGRVGNLEALRNLPETRLAELIYPVGFYKTKAKNIKRVCEILASEHDGDIPNTLEGLLRLPGVGPKMAHLAMNCAWHVVSGIGVDTHVHRISNRIGWVRKPTKTPEDTRVALERWLPRDLWATVNQLLVGFGQQTCTPTNPKCSTCANAPVCPSAPHRSAAAAASSSRGVVVGVAGDGQKRATDAKASQATTSKHAESNQWRVKEDEEGGALRERRPPVGLTKEDEEQKRRPGYTKTRRAPSKSQQKVEEALKRDEQEYTMRGYSLRSRSLRDERKKTKIR